MRVFAVARIAIVSALLFLPALARAQDATLAGEWLKFRDRFVGDDGRVRDSGNKNISHTEGQGVAMLFAETFDDHATFDHVWNWTRDKLRQHDGALFSWRWDPDAKNPIADPNNATDGDVLIAWALARATQRWRTPAYAAEARPIIAAIREKLIVSAAGGLVLLPGADGFMRKDGTVIINPSYYVYPALETFPRLDPSPKWARLRYDGLRLLAKARFGTWNLPPDWITIDAAGKLSPSADPPPRFGYNAIRIPLYLVWGHEATRQRLAAEMRFWDGFGDKPVPAWVDVTNGAVAPFPAPSGFQAIIDLVRARLGGKAVPLPQIADADDYYSASLILLANMANRGD
ncbi:MAG TPA: glycosyl hydrolase family 8 [Stellaceae bacterium]|jgi:endo-1,4-beta-D-glucanase Y|nr:glycosyl hydrolase family 8 [Stellaceae bacterium]